MPLRVVFDTNIWIAGLNWRGAPYRCLLLARTGLVQLVYCQPMAAELSIKLRERFRFSENDIRAIMYELRRMGELVTITGDLRVVVDPDDDKFVECALVGKADLIVSQDRHLLDITTYAATRIMSAHEFLTYVAALPPE